MVRRWIAALLLGLAASSAWANDASGTITILEGDALVYRGAGRLIAAEGLRLAAGDIVETGAKTFARIETADRSVIDLGPDTRVMISGAARGKAERSLYFLGGWAKIANPAKADAAGASGVEVRTPLFEYPPTPGVVVFQMKPAELMLFVERGELRLAERYASGPSATVALKAGDYYQRKGRGKGQPNAPEARVIVAQMPRQFRDTLPSRLDKFAGRDVKAKEAPAFAYADVEDWLKAESAIRRPLMQRWRAKARESAFRSALVANLSSHPEWDPILFPEKYLPKEPKGQPSAAASTESAKPQPAR